MNYNLDLCKLFRSLQEGQARKENRIEFRNFFEGFSFHILQYEPSNLFQLQIYLRAHLRTALVWVVNQRVICLFLALQPPVGHGLIIHEVSRSHSSTHHNQYDSAGRVISSSQRPLHDNAHNAHNRQTSMSPVGFEPTISAGERPQTYALDRVATGNEAAGSVTKLPLSAA